MLIIAAMQAAVDAASDGKVVVPYGQWLADLVPWLAVGVGGVGAWLFRFLPAQYQWVARVAQLDQLLDRAIQYAVNQIPGAVREQVFTVEIGNRVVEGALEYALRHGPGIVKQYASGPLSILREKILARIRVQ